jgi:hypothetical protein
MSTGRSLAEATTGVLMRTSGAPSDFVAFRPPSDTAGISLGHDVAGWVMGHYFERADDD